MMERLQQVDDLCANCQPLSKLLPALLCCNKPATSHDSNTNQPKPSPELPPLSFACTMCRHMGIVPPPLSP